MLQSNNNVKNLQTPLIREAYMKYVSGFNDRQAKSAAMEHDKSLRIIAGAGAGKTATIIARCLSLTIRDGISPDRIACVTFTRKAAKEMSDRYLKFWKDLNIDLSGCMPRFSTIHSLEYHLIHKYFNHYNCSILSEYNSRKLLTDIAKKHLPKEKCDSGSMSKLEMFKNMLSNKLLSVGMFLPVFSAPNRFDKVVPAIRRGESFEYPKYLSSSVKILKALSYSGLKFAYQHNIRDNSYSRVFDDSIDSLIVKAVKALLMIYDLKYYEDEVRMVLAEYYSQKFSARTYDFSDMAFLSHILMAQFPDRLGYIQSQLDYVICDECQDSPPSQIALLICLQNDTYNEYFNSVGVSLDWNGNQKFVTADTLHQAISSNGGMLTCDFGSDILSGL